jgi:ribosome recycling factor
MVAQRPKSAVIRKFSTKLLKTTQLKTSVSFRQIRVFRVLKNLRAFFAYLRITARQPTGNKISSFSKKYSFYLYASKFFENRENNNAMTEEAEMLLEMTEEGMQQSLDHLEKEFRKIRASKANPSMLDGIHVEVYGSSMPLNQIANISTPDPRTLTIQPWDKNNLHLIEKEIINSNLGFNPMNDGELIRINVPILTEERRNDLVKRARHEAENAKIGIRNHRRSANEDAKAMEKDGLPEDEVKRLQDKIQKLTDDYIEKVEKALEIKEKDITTV